MTDPISHLFTLVDAYRATIGISEATLSTRVLGDGKRLAAIRGGRDIGVRTYARVLAWFAAHWPEGLAWPADIPRPAAPEVGAAGSAPGSTPTREPATTSGGAP